MRLGTGAKLSVTWPADKKIGWAKVDAGNTEAVISISTTTTPKNIYRQRLQTIKTCPKKDSIGPAKKFTGGPEICAWQSCYILAFTPVP